MASAAAILYNGNILTMTGAEEAAQAVAVGRDGRILAVGTRAEVRNLAQARHTRRSTCAGEPCCPASSTAICICCGWASIWAMSIWLRRPCGSKQDIVRLLRERLDAQPDLTCVQGNRYDQNKLSPPEHLTRARSGSGFHRRAGAHRAYVGSRRGRQHAARWRCWASRATRPTRWAAKSSATPDGRADGRAAGNRQLERSGPHSARTLTPPNR